MKAIISTGGNQYLVEKGDQLRVELVKGKTLKFTPLAVIDGASSKIGTPEVSGASVSAKLVEESISDPKVIAIRYKAKKRVHKRIGHRQKKSLIEITSISA